MEIFSLPIYSIKEGSLSIEVEGFFDETLVSLSLESCATFLWLVQGSSSNPFVLAGYLLYWSLFKLFFVLRHSLPSSMVVGTISNPIIALGAKSLPESGV